MRRMNVPGGMAGSLGLDHTMENKNHPWRVVGIVLLGLALVMSVSDVAIGRDSERKSAEKFAHQVMEAVERISNDYVLELNRGEMVSWAVAGMYDRLGEKMPSAMA